MKSKKEIIVGIILAVLIILISNKSMATTATVNTDTLKFRGKIRSNRKSWRLV